MEFINIALRNTILIHSYPKIFDFVVFIKFRGQYNFFFLVTSKREKHQKDIRCAKGLLGFKFLYSLVHYKIKIRKDRKVGN